MDYRSALLALADQQAIRYGYGDAIMGPDQAWTALVRGVDKDHTVYVRADFLGEDVQYVERHEVSSYTPEGRKRAHGVLDEWDNTSRILISEGWHWIEARLARPEPGYAVRLEGAYGNLRAELHRFEAGEVERAYWFADFDSKLFEADEASRRYLLQWLPDALLTHNFVLADRLLTVAEEAQANRQ